MKCVDCKAGRCEDCWGLGLTCDCCRDAFDVESLEATDD